MSEKHLEVTMKVMKSLLLGSAASLVVAAGAQAADLPVKAKAVEYVKICSAYGAGFYYIPGTDVCLRVGGYVRADYYIHERAGAPFTTAATVGAEGQYTRDDNGMTFRARGVVILDARTNTAYGTLRAYIAAGATYDTDAAGQSVTGAISTAFVQNPNQINYTPYVERAFIQFAGFTFGFTQSFYDFPGGYLYGGSLAIPLRWLPVLSYTAQFGNGISGTLSLEDATARRAGIEGSDQDGGGTAGTGNIASANTSVCNTATLASAAGSFTFQRGGNCYGGQYIPDIVGNIRVDQAWGSAQVQAALHELRVNAGFRTIPGGSATVDNRSWGYAFGGGVEIKTPMWAPQDTVTLQANWTKGAADYTGFGQSPVGPSTFLGQKNTGAPATGTGPIIDTFDAFVDPTGAYNKPVAWSVGVQGRHFWTPALRSAIAAGYFRFNSPTIAETWNYPDGRAWQVGANTIWSPAKGLDLGVEVFYTHIKTSTPSGTAATAPTAGQLAEWGQSKGVWGGMFRAQSNF
jgi:hypothetical protein